MRDATGRPPMWKRLQTLLTVPRILLYSCLLLACTAAVMAGCHTPRASELAVHGTAREMGLEYGRETRVTANLLSRIYLQRVLCGNDKQQLALRAEQATNLLSEVDGRYRDELLAFSEVSGIDYGILAYGNTFLEVGNIAMACRSVVIQSDQGLLHAHNLDWDDMGGLARWTLCIVRRNPSDERLRTLAICYPGMVGALDIINEKGVALSFNQLGFGAGLSKEPIFLLLRRIAETAADFDTARQAILDAPDGLPFIITLSAAAAGRAAVFERLGNTITERPLNTQGALAAANTAMGTEATGSRLYTVLDEIKPQTLEDVKRFLRHEQVLVSANVYSLVFAFDSNRMYLAYGRMPAAPLAYREYVLFE